MNDTGSSQGYIGTLFLSCQPTAAAAGVASKRNDGYAADLIAIPRNWIARRSDWRFAWRRLSEELAARRNRSLGDMEKARRKAVLNCDMFENPHARETSVTVTSRAARASPSNCRARSSRSVFKKLPGRLHPPSRKRVVEVPSSEKSRQALATCRECQIWIRPDVRE